MWRMFCVLLLLFWGVAESRHIKPLQESLKTVRTSVAIFPNGLGGTTGLHLSRIEAHPNVIDADVDDLVLIREPNLKRAPRVPRDGRTKQRETQFSQNFRYPRPYDAGGYFTTPRNTDSPNHSHGRRRNDTNPLGIHNPLYPVTDDSYGAYAVMLLSLIVFAVGIVGNLAVMCIVWQNYYMKTTWNCILASLAFWDFLVLFFCLPVVIFNELTKRRLLGDLSCRIVPYMEVTSLGVATFSLCALSIDRFHTATSIQPKPRLVEPCQSILAKLSVVWVGSMVLAAPELLLWQLHKDVSPLTGLPLDMCVQRPSPDLPESVFSLVLTYHEARMWWSFGCFFCLPLLFTLACQLLTRHVTEEAKQASSNGRSLSTSIKSSSSSSSSSSSPKRQQQQQREQQLTRTVIALATVYGVCGLPENAANIVLTSAGLEVSVGVQALLQLVGQFLMFARASATPVILLCLCRALGQTFMDCCCCCCEECLPDRSSSTSTTSSASSQVTATTGTTGTSSSPSASPVSSVPEEKLQIISGTTPTPAILFDKAKDDSSILAIGTPC